MISLIAAVGRNGEVGQGGKLPWPKLRADLKYFAQLTRGHPVVLGRKTWESLPDEYRPLPGRGNLVLSADRNWYPVGDCRITQAGVVADATTWLDVYREPAEVVAQIDDLRQLELNRGQQHGSDEVFVIGGRRVWEAFWPMADRIWLTKVDIDAPDADTFFPGYPGQHQGDFSLYADFEEHELKLLPAAKPYPLGFYRFDRKIPRESV